MFILDKWLLNGTMVLTVAHIGYGGGMMAFLTDDSDAASILTDMLGGDDTDGCDTLGLISTWYPAAFGDTVQEAVITLRDEVQRDLESRGKDYERVINLFSRSLVDTKSKPSASGLRCTFDHFNQQLQEWSIPHYWKLG